MWEDQSDRQHERRCIQFADTTIVKEPNSLWKKQSKLQLSAVQAVQHGRP